MCALPVSAAVLAHRGQSRTDLMIIVIDDCSKITFCCFCIAWYKHYRRITKLVQSSEIESVVLS